MPVEPAPVWSLDQARRQPGSYKLGPAAGSWRAKVKQKPSENSLKIIHSSHGREDHYMVIMMLGLVMVSALLLAVPSHHLLSVWARPIREKPESDKYLGRQLMVTTINKCPNVLN